MSILDYTLILIIAAGVVMAVKFINKQKKSGGCSGCCSSCNRACSKSNTLNKAE